MQDVYQAFGGPWALLGFLAVVVPVVCFYAFKGSSGRRRNMKRPPGAPDIDEGIDV